jgi:LAGLIDADG DNA endonuclease family
MKTNNNYTIFKRFYRKSPKYDLILDSNLKEIIYGCILGDLHVEKKNVNSNARLQFRYSTINKDYSYHLYNLFEMYCGKPPIILNRFDERPNKFKNYSSIKFQTLNLPCFNEFRNTFYDINGKKIIPLNIEELLTAKSLAY